jgi:hypothetical protein
MGLRIIDAHRTCESVFELCELVAFIRRQKGLSGDEIGGLLFDWGTKGIYHKSDACFQASVPTSPANSSIIPRTVGATETTPSKE